MRQGLIALLIGLLLPLAAWSGVLPQIPEARKGESCVRPTDEMRKNHMKYILHQRDETVHEGYRNPQFSLVECINCHATKDEKGEWVSVKTEKHFCNSCHTYAAVKIDCFQCHADKPEEAYEQARHPVMLRQGLSEDTIRNTLMEARQ